MRTLVTWGLALCVCLVLVVAGFQIAHADELVGTTAPSFGDILENKWQAGLEDMLRRMSGEIDDMREDRRRRQER